MSESQQEGILQPPEVEGAEEDDEKTGTAGFLLDLARCVGCGSCVVACRIENDLPRGLSWRRVVSFNLPRWEGGATYHFTVACHHCEEAPCVRGCPSGALAKRTDGVVTLKSSLCIGCRYCQMVCPFGAPAYYRDAGVMTKCTLCSHRLDQGLEPACVDACPTRALGFSWEVKASEDYVPAGDMPGFADPGSAGPSIRFSPPKGAVREGRHRQLLERLTVGNPPRGGPKGAEE